MTSPINDATRPFNSATPIFSTSRSVHEDVLPPVPLPTIITTPAHTPATVIATTPSTQPRPTTASVNGLRQQQVWLSTITEMEAQPGADLAELQLIRSYITEGITLPFLSTPPPITYANTDTVTENEAAVRIRLQEYISFGAVVELPSSYDTSTHGIQPLHCIIKEGKKPRLVIDLSRNLNDHLQLDHFQYASVEDAVETAWPNCWFGKLDLTNCFLSFPLHPSVRPFFCFRFDGKLYQFRHMPFGLNTAPRMCTQLLSVVAFALSQKNNIHVRYLDDFFLIGDTANEVCEQLESATETMHSFGLVVNPSKTEGPSQVLSFLGIELDSVKQTLSCTPARVAELTGLLQSLRRKRVVTRHDAESLIGKLSFAAQVLPGARPFMRRMLDTVHACRSKRRSTPIHIDPSFRADVRFWLHHLSDWNGTQTWRSSRTAPFVFASDASLHGFGFYLESTPTPSTVDSSTWPQPLQLGATFSGTYATEHAQYHQSHTQIAWCELVAVVAALRTYAPYLMNQSVQFIVDNSTDVHIINRQATRSKGLAGLLRQLYSIALQHNIRIHAVHRPGVENTLADFLSRPALHQNRHVAEWRVLYPADAFRLSSVSCVSSAQYLDSSSSFPAVPSGSTLSERTVHTRGRSNVCASLSASTRSLPSARNTCAQLSSSTPDLIVSPQCQASSRPSRTTLSVAAIPPSLAVAPIRTYAQALITGMATPTSASHALRSPSTTCVSSMPTSTCQSSRTLGTGARVCSPSMASFASRSTPAAASA